jgi:anti-sigma-K factor RskA
MNDLRIIIYGAGSWRIALKVTSMAAALVGDFFALTPTGNIWNRPKAYVLRTDGSKAKLLTPKLTRELFAQQYGETAMFKRMVREG